MAALGHHTDVPEIISMHNKVFICNIVNSLLVMDFFGGNFKIFYSHSRDLYGMPHASGKCVLITVEGVHNLLLYFQNTLPKKSA